MVSTTANDEFLVSFWPVHSRVRCFVYGMGVLRHTSCSCSCSVIGVGEGRHPWSRVRLLNSLVDFSRCSRRAGPLVFERINLATFIALDLSIAAPWFLNFLPRGCPAQPALVCATNHRPTNPSSSCAESLAFFFVTESHWGNVCSPSMAGLTLPAAGLIRVGDAGGSSIGTRVNCASMIFR